MVGPSTERKPVGATPKASLGEGLEGVYSFQKLSFFLNNEDFRCNLVTHESPIY